MTLQTLKVSKELHNKIKIYCVQHDIKMLKFVEEVLQNELNKQEKINETKNKMDKKMSKL